MNKSEGKLTRLEKSWILYDVGNSAFIMLISTIIPIYFKNVASADGVTSANSTAYWGYAMSISTLIVAAIGPVLGALADTRGYKKPMFTLFLMLGALGCASLSLPVPWIIFLAVFVFARVGISGSFIFYDAMLPDVTSDIFPRLCVGLYRKLHSFYNQSLNDIVCRKNRDYHSRGNRSCFYTKCLMVGFIHPSAS